MPSEYDCVPQSGKLKLKGTRQHQYQLLDVEKKEKKKRRKEKKPEEQDQKEIEIDEQGEKEIKIGEQYEQLIDSTSNDAILEEKILENQALALKYQTKAQLRYLSMRQKQLKRVAKKKATKTYKTRILEYNSYLENMTDEHEQAKVSWCKQYQ